MKRVIWLLSHDEVNQDTARGFGSEHRLTVQVRHLMDVFIKDIERPRFFEDLLSAIGAEPVEYPLKLRCCGGSLIVTNRKAALTMVHQLLQNAVDSGAVLIATTCPLCQINLECYQRHVNRMFGTTFALPIVYFTQLMGLALGASPTQLGIGTEVISPTQVLECKMPAAAGGAAARAKVPVA